MPALLPIQDVARCAFRGTASSQNIVNVLHVRKQPALGAGFTQAEVDTLATSLATIWTTRMLPSINNNYAAKDVTVTDLTSSLGVVAVKPMTGNGAAASTGMSNAGAAAISWKIARHYRGGHPRTYVGPIGSVAVTSGTTLLAGYVTTLATAAGLLRSDINAITLGAGSVELVALHRTRGLAVLNPPQVSPITGAAVDDRIDSQRRRLGRDR